VVTVGKRELVLRSIPELEAELDRLETAYVETCGVWSFAQILHHLALSAEWANGESVGILPDTLPKLDRPELGQKFFQRMVRSGKFPQIENSAAPHKREEGDIAKEIAYLRRSLEKFKNEPGQSPVHFFFGELTRDQWATWIAFHAGHHLAFAIGRDRKTL